MVRFFFALLMVFSFLPLAQAQETLFGQNQETFFVRSFDRTECEKWRSRLIEVGYRQSDGDATFALACADLADSEGALIGAYRETSDGAKIAIYPTLKPNWVGRSTAVPKKIETIDDVIDLVSSVNVITTRAIQMVVPPDQNGNAPTLKVHRFVVPRGPVETGDTSAFMGLLMEVKFK